jgi:biopolymer transport protein TolR
VSAGSTPAQQKGKGGEQDFELNLASIIDCFTVLITYLLVSASFITLGTFDVTVATPSDQAEESDPPPSDVQLSIRIAEDAGLKLELSGRDQRQISIPARSPGSMDLDSMEARVLELRENYPALDGAMVSAHDTVKYRQIVQLLERARPVLPKVALTGEGP